MNTGGGGPQFWEWLQKLNLLSLENRDVKGDTITIYRYINGDCAVQSNFCEDYTLPHDDVLNYIRGSLLLEQ